MQPEGTVKIAREWATPLTIGSFAVIGVTGVLMFFHVDSGLNKLVHEWFSWVLLAGVGLHAAANGLAFKRYFSQPRGRVILAAGAALLALSFVPARGSSGGEPPFMASVKALAAVPLPTLALVAGVPVTEVQARLQAAGLQAGSANDSVQSLAGPDRKRQMQVLRQVLQGAQAS